MGNRICSVLLVAAAVGCAVEESGGSSASSTEADHTNSGVAVAIPAAAPETPDGARLGASTPGSVGQSRRPDHSGDEVAQLLQQNRQLWGQAQEQQAGLVWERIVANAAVVLQQTMADANRGSEFVEAARQLLNARLQLALTGEQRAVTQLYADAEVFDAQDPASPAAAEAIYVLAKFAHTMAGRTTTGRTAWYLNFSQWARTFADRFPDQSERAVDLLSGAARSCDMLAGQSDRQNRERLLNEVRLCCMALRDGWSREVPGQEAVAVLRRLDVVGRRLTQFSGPLLSGGYFTADQLSGQMTVIYFWDSQGRVFREEWAPLLRGLSVRLEYRGVQWVGVNLDLDAEQCEATANQWQLPGQQICSRQAKTVGWESPLVRYWGISHSPLVWLLSRDGVVQSTNVHTSQLEPLIQGLFGIQ